MTIMVNDMIPTVNRDNAQATTLIVLANILNSHKSAMFLLL